MKRQDSRQTKGEETQLVFLSTSLTDVSSWKCGGPVTASYITLCKSCCMVVYTKQQLVWDIQLAHACYSFSSPQEWYCGVRNLIESHEISSESGEREWFLSERGNVPGCRVHTGYTPFEALLICISPWQPLLPWRGMPYGHIHNHVYTAAFLIWVYHVTPVEQQIPVPVW
jgi:hypothetical protein